MVPSVTRTLLTLALAGWCSVLPVMAQVCPCALVLPGTAVDTEIDQPVVKPRLAAKRCCEHCVVTPVSDAVGLGSDRGDQDRTCQCDQLSTFQLFPAEVSKSKRQISVVVQPIGASTAWSVAPQSDGGAFESPPPLVLPLQRKLASLGVWRL